MSVTSTMSRVVRQHPALLSLGRLAHLVSSSQETAGGKTMTSFPSLPLRREVQLLVNEVLP